MMRSMSVFDEIDGISKINGIFEKGEPMSGRFQIITYSSYLIPSFR